MAILRTVLFILMVIPFMSLAQQNYNKDTLKVFIKMDKPQKEGWFNPAKESVGLRGDIAPLSWSNTMVAEDFNEDLIYEISLPFKISLDSITISFKIKVDGADNPNGGWQEGQNHVFTIKRGVKNVLHIAWEDKPAALKSTKTGNVQMVEDFKCRYLANRNLHIYFPPGYEGSDAKYPVLYMHDGQMLFDQIYGGSEWQLDEAAEKLISSDVVEPFIIVGVSNTSDRIDEYTPTRQKWSHTFHRQSADEVKVKSVIKGGLFVTEDSTILKVKNQSDTIYVIIPGSDTWQRTIRKSKHQFYLQRAGINFDFIKDSKGDYNTIKATKPPMGGKGDDYAKFLIEKVMPYIENNYRVKKGPNNTALGGSSLGGLITMYIGLKYPYKFGSLLVLSPSVWWDNKYILSEVTSLSKPTNQRIFLYVGTGEGQSTIDNTKQLYNKLLAKGWNPESIEYIVTPDATHSEKAWAEQAENMLRFLFEK
mgnify:CR=1 FL=1